MASVKTGSHERNEHCETCDTQTPHTVRVELRTESDTQNNAQYSREPYRVSECSLCGRTSDRRMNNA